MASLIDAGLLSDRPKNYFGLIKLALKLAGINIDGNDSAAYRIYSISVVLFVNILYVLLDFLELFKQEFAVAAESLFLYIFAFSLASIKTFVVILKRNKFAKLLNKLEQEPFTPNPNRGGEEEVKLIKECIWLNNAQTFTYWSAGLVCLIATMCFSFIKRIRSNDYHDWILPYGPLTVLNVTYSPNYEITCIYQIISSSYFAMQFFSIDLIITAALSHISYQFKILQNNIRRLLRISYEEMLKETGSADLLPENVSVEIGGSVIPWKYLKNSLIDAINYHSAIISIAEEMESLVSSLLLTVFLATLGMLCFLVYETSTFSLGDSRIWFPAGQLICTCFQVAIVCYWGEQVVFQSQEVGIAAFDANFVGTDLRFQKSLALIIRRSQNPAILTTGKFSVISLQTFAWTLRTSYSAFMMLRKTQN